MTKQPVPRYRAVLFDIDDTLFKTREPKWRQHQWVAKHYYGIELSDKELRTHWGKPFDELAGALYRGRGTHKERRANFIRHELEFPKEYEPHAQELIEALHAAGVKLGLMTSMFWEGALVDLKNLRVPLEYFSVLQGAEGSLYHKPDGRVFEPALATLGKLGIEPADVVYVAETFADLRAAKDAGLDFIAVPFGSTTAHQFEAAGVDVIFDSLEQVKRYLLGPKN